MTYLTFFEKDKIFYVIFKFQSVSTIIEACATLQRFFNLECIKRCTTGSTWCTTPSRYSSVSFFVLQILFQSWNISSNSPGGPREGSRIARVQTCSSKKLFSQLYPPPSSLTFAALYSAYLCVLGSKIMKSPLLSVMRILLSDIAIFDRFGLKIWGLERPNIDKIDFFPSRTMCCRVTKVKTLGPIIF